MVSQKHEITHSDSNSYKYEVWRCSCGIHFGGAEAARSHAVIANTQLGDASGEIKKAEKRKLKEAIARRSWLKSLDAGEVNRLGWSPQDWKDELFVCNKVIIAHRTISE